MIQKYHEDFDYTRGSLYELCGYGPEDLGVPKLEYSDFSSKWSRLFHLMILQCGITFFLVYLAIPLVLIWQEDDENFVKNAML